ncbi:MAG: acyl-CoA thioesterase [Flavobacterium sp.]|nr:MAG: acyl-CoA thioesterase [Flavobacterium sp.]
MTTITWPVFQHLSINSKQQTKLMEKSPTSQYKVRFNDCDLFGHLNNSRYLDYLINAREDHLAEYYDLDLSAHYKKGFGWVVGSHEISYVIPAVYNEMIKIQSALIHCAADSLEVETVMFDGAATHLKAVMRTKLVHVNTQTGRKEPHGDDFLVWAKTIENNGIDRDIALPLRVKQLKDNLRQNSPTPLK